MDAIKNKINVLSEERSTILAKMDEIRNYYDQLNSRVIEINGALKTLSEMVESEEGTDTEEVLDDTAG